MDAIYLVMVGFLTVLAVGDLFAGVSNDASNFLNAAIGSRTASFRTVMVVASLGVLFGATFSGGMMEIARCGVFNPSLFSFEDLMYVFFAVVVTDVLLLNFFNSFGLPTSTTVSIIFELMGASVSMAALKIATSDASFLELGDYINNSRALLMIAAIVVSVPAAFLLGAFVQWVSRLVFTFDIARTGRFIAAPFASVCLCAICYFLVLKGIDGSALATPEAKAFIHANMGALAGGLFAFFLALFLLLAVAFKTDVLRIVILSGTFALAFSFAGNDLVNFVGVPLAALDSYRMFSGQELPASEFMMASLREPAGTATAWLVASGTVMALTLWFSKKALRVVQTTINLSSSERGDREQFGSSLPARLIVRFCIDSAEMLARHLPRAAKTAAAERFAKLPVKRGEPVLPFDAVRACINLVVASVLIAAATSLTLPLSTTYVCFMVAMGTSLADGAWDRETAVYRVSGVLTVITGWFITAFSAFTASSLILLVCYYGEIFAAVALMALVSWVFVKVNVLGKNETGGTLTRRRIDRFAVRDLLNRAVLTNFAEVIRLTDGALKDFFRADLSGLKRDLFEAVEAYDGVQRMRAEYYNMARKGSEADHDACYFYYRAFTNMKEVNRELERTLRMVHDHVANSHRIYRASLQEDMFELVGLLKGVQAVLGEYERVGALDVRALSQRTQKTIAFIEKMQDNLIFRIDEEGLSLRSSELYLSILQFVRVALNRYNIVFLMLKELNDKCDEALAGEPPGAEPAAPQAQPAIHDLEEALMKPQTAHLIGRLFAKRPEQK